MWSGSLPSFRCRGDGLHDVFVDEVEQVVYHVHDAVDDGDVEVGDPGTNHVVGHVHCKTRVKIWKGLFANWYQNPLQCQKLENTLC